MSASRAKNGRGKSKTATREMMETVILAKLHGDGLIVVDEGEKTATLDCRRDVIVSRYEESSYDDIRDIMEKTAKGLRLGGYEATVKYLDL